MGRQPRNYRDEDSSKRKILNMVELTRFFLLQSGLLLGLLMVPASIAFSAKPLPHEIRGGGMVDAEISLKPAKSEESKCPITRIKKFAQVNRFFQTQEGGKPTENISLEAAADESSSAPSSSPRSSVMSPLDILSPFESMCMSAVEAWYLDALAIKCPFFRRRATDILDVTDYAMRALVLRHHVHLLPPPPSIRCDGKACNKAMFLSMEELKETIRRDWKEDTKKGYYVTGRLNPSIYRDDCLFDGPDPDMPVRGLRKYLNAASQLFCQKNSHCELLSLEVKDDVIEATWRMTGILRLPWRPTLPTVTGKTIYYPDHTGLIERHVETWDMSAYRAFAETLLPDFGSFWLRQQPKFELAPSGYWRLFQEVLCVV